MLSPERTMQGKPLVWLDNASTTMKPRCVIDAMDVYYNETTANTHRGDYDLCYAMDQKLGQTRAAVARFINADINEVVFTSGTTNSINLIASAYGLSHLHAGDEILLTAAEHASNVLPWYEVAKRTGAVVKFIALDSEGKVTIENVEKALSEKTKIIALAQITNVLGFEAPIKEICALAHKHGAIVAVDGAQSVPHRKTDVKDLDCDFLSFSGHKMCAPTGIGVLYGKYELLQQMDPYMVGGGMNVKFYENGTATYLDAPAKFEAGTMNLSGICGLYEAIRYLESIGMDAINEREIQLKRYAIEKLKKLDNVIIYNENSEAGIVSFNIKGVFAQDGATWMNSKGIAVRSGQHCAKMLNGYLDTPATIRASFYFYTTEEEIDRLVEAAKEGENYLDAYFN